MSVVFTYGNLKRGQPYNYLLENSSNGQAEFLGEAITEERFPLVTLPIRNFPFLLAAKGQGERVSGEVFAVDDKMLEILDGLEVHPQLYTRTSICVCLESASPAAIARGWSSGSVISVECYLLFDFKPEMLELPKLNRFCASEYPVNMTTVEEYHEIDVIAEVKVVK